MTLLEQPSAERGLRVRRWWRDRGPRLLTAAVLTWAVGWIAALFLAPDSLFDGRFIDAGTYYGAGRAYLHGTNLFAAAAFRQWPLVAAMWSPLAIFRQPVANRIWVFLSLVAIAAGFAALCFRQRREQGPAQRGRVIALFLGPPTLIMLYLGQMSGLCFAAYALGLCLMPRRPRLAGCCFALMAAKPNLALIALPALLAAPPSAALACILAALIWPVGSVLVSGPAPLVDFMLRLYAVRDTTLGLVSSSLGSLFPLTGKLHTLVQLSLLAALLGVLGWLLWRRLRGDVLSAGAVDLAAVVVLAALPYALVSDLLFVLPLLLRLTAARGRAASVLFAAWWLLPWLAALLAHAGGGGLAALLPPLVVLVAWRLLRPRWQKQPSAETVAVRRERPDITTRADVAAVGS